MAEVLLARQQGIAGFEKLVVAKRVLPQLRDDGRFVEMFLNEARIAASLRHPNIVEIYDVVRDEDDFFIVMEYLSGEDARTILRRARREDFAVPVGVACRVVADAAAGLEYAHNAVGSDGQPLGIVHRDVGPTNLLVTYTGMTKLLDFGLAKANVHNIYTKPGTLKGKYGYASPEQVQHEKLDARSDVFSLAVVLWELLTVRRLFSGRTPAEVLHAVMERRVPPPSAFNPLVPRELDEVVAAALQRDRNKRTESAKALAAQLENVLEKLRLHAGTHQVGSWMQTALAEHYEERREVEQAVVAGRDDLHDEPVAEIPAAFRALRSPSGSSPHVCRLSSAVDRSPSSTVLSRPPSRASSLSAVSSSSSESVESSMGARVDTPPIRDRSRGLLWVVLVVLLLSLLGVAFLLGRVMSDPSRPVRVHGPLHGEFTVKSTFRSTVAFLLRVSPAGAQLDVDGHPFEHPVGADGVLVEVPADRVVELVVRKPGYRTTTRRVRSPERGTLDIFLNLRPVEDGTPLAGVLADSSTRTTGRSPPRRRRSSRVKSAKGAKRSNGARRSNGGGTAKARRQSLRRRRGRPSTRALALSSVSIVTEPSGALVEVEGRLAGRTPLRDLRLESGKPYRLTVRLPGFEVWSETVTLRANARRTLKVALKPVEIEPTSPVAPTAEVSTEDAAKSESRPPLRVARARIGDSSAGAARFRSRCRTCHGRTASEISSRDKTVRQWVSFFAYGRHHRHAPLEGILTVSELADIKAYLMKNAFDVDSDMAAGIR